MDYEKPNRKYAKRTNVKYQRYRAAESLRDDSIPEELLERPETLDDIVKDDENDLFGGESGLSKEDLGLDEQGFRDDDGAE